MCHYSGSTALVGSAPEAFALFFVCRGGQGGVRVLSVVTAAATLAWGLHTVLPESLHTGSSAQAL